MRARRDGDRDAFDEINFKSSGRPISQAHPMKIGDTLHFAPRVAFSDLDISAHRLPSQYSLRVEGFYLKPAEELIESGHAFAAGVLIFCAIDALAKVEDQRAAVNTRFKNYCRDRLESFRKQGYAEMLWEGYRNGLVHEARAKNGLELSLESKAAVELMDSGIRVNPTYLLSEVRVALQFQIQEITENKEKLKNFRDFFIFQFAEELRNAGFEIQ